MTCYHTVLQSVFALATSLTAPSCLDGGLLSALRSVVEVVTGFIELFIFWEGIVASVRICAVLSIVEFCLLVSMLLYELLLLKIIFVAGEN